jgi:hypothetical protein
MKKLSVILLALVLGLVATGLAFAADITITNVIPNRYALMVFTKADPGVALDKEIIVKLAREHLEKLSVKDMQYIVYDEGKEAGGGLFRAYGELTTDTGKDVVDFQEFAINENDTEEEKKKKLDQMVLVEKSLGYQTTPKELHDAYTDNEVVADEDFKGKSVIMEVTVPQVSKDAFGKPHIKIPVDQYGLFGVTLNLSIDDPLLRSIKKGSNIIVHGQPTGLILNDVQVRAEIVMIN